MQSCCWPLRSALRQRHSLTSPTGVWTSAIRDGFQRSFTTTSARRAGPLKVQGELEQRIAKIPIERFRNFCIVAHVDHGKSTLSDRLLELTGTIEPGGKKQILDKLDVERERGITVKAQTCSMIYNYMGEDYLLHLVDTPGHVDFRAEVSRSYASCGGALLLVDASQGVQAQTVANFYLAFAQNLALVPVLNKVDLPSADKDRVLEQLQDTFELDGSNAIGVSAKTGMNVDKILPTIIEQIPAPVGKEASPLKVLLVDSWYDNYKGVILLVRIFEGQIRAGDRIKSFATGSEYIVGEVGIMYPLETPQTVLRAGQVGYIYFNPGMKRSKEAKIGDTYTHTHSISKVEPLPGFEEPQSMVFVSAFPTDQSEFSRLEDSINQLTLNDRSVLVTKESSEALGAGWRLGFLGTLHCSVFEDRLRQEHGASIIITPPSVPFKVVWKGGKEEVISNPNHFPDSQTVHGKIESLQEPYITATITMPEEYLGKVIELCEGNRGEQESLSFFTATQVILKYALPLERLVDDFFGKLKSATKGYASLDYEEAGYKDSNIAKLQLHVNKAPVDAVARVIHISQAQRLGKEWVSKFKEHVDRQMFEVVIQAVVGKSVVARETLKPFRKDVLQKLHAADASRRKKLLEKQKEGRRKLRAVGNVAIDNKAFQSFLANLTRSTPTTMPLEKLEGVKLPAAADMHVHLRENEMMELVTPMIRRGGVNTVFVMPNLVPPITTVAHCLAYKKQLQELAPDVTFLMSLYLHPHISPATVKEAKQAGITGIKSYPHGVTTHSDHGVMSYEQFYPVFEEMERQDMVLNLHGELPPSQGQDITVLNAEESFLPTLKDLHRRFPNLRIILEHCTSAAAIQAVKDCGPTVAATITAHHPFLIVDDWAGDPHCFCKPVAKLPSDRRAILKTLISGDPKFFFGTDSAPHPAHTKRADRFAAGVFTQPHAVGYVVDALEQGIETGVLAEEDVTKEKLQGFLCDFGRKFYKVQEERQDKISLQRRKDVVEEVLRSEDGKVEVVPFRRGRMTWEAKWL
ncbi:Translation factor GUF1 [Hortaea werneckii]|nr:Translation factor GUF1 [Hortaea werneckii]